MLTNYEPLLKAMILKFQALSVGGVQIPVENVVIGECDNFLTKPSSFYPRLEILPIKYKGDGFVAQTQMECEYRFGVGGYLHRGHNNVEAQDMYDLMKFASDTMNAIWSFHNDSIQGNPPCPEFESLVGFPEVFFEYSTNPNLSEFLFVFGINDFIEIKSIINNPVHYLQTIR